MPSFRRESFQHFQSQTYFLDLYLTFILPTLSRDSFFQDMVNRIVQIVHHGLIRPHDGARLLHTCASILDMQLLKAVPCTTVVIRGLRKTNDLAQGHHFLVDSFGAFGDIVDASISPKNRGFGKSSNFFHMIPSLSNHIN
jgi:hypothetical protein